jgi:hypothetical protein
VTFQSVNKELIERVLWLVPEPVQAQLQRENVVLAGGCIRDTAAWLEVKDLDIFCHSEEQASRLAHEVSPLVRHTTFAYSVELNGKPVQYVFYKDFTDIYDLIGQFDFRACCAGLRWNPLMGWDGIAVDGFLEDCDARVLHFMSQKKDEGKLTALRRALNFAKKGWSIKDGDVAGILLHWQGAKPDELDYAEKHADVCYGFRPCYGRV